MYKQFSSQRDSVSECTSIQEVLHAGTMGLNSHVIFVHSTIANSEKCERDKHKQEQCMKTVRLCSNNQHL